MLLAALIGLLRHDLNKDMTRTIRCLVWTFCSSFSLLAFADIKVEGLDTLCASQESKLAVLWNIGIFALNFGPVIIGPILDYVGPKLTSILGRP